MQNACKLLRRYARILPVARPSSLHFQGHIKWLMGKKKQANHLWQQSLIYAEELKMLYEQGRAHYEIGRHMDANDLERQNHLQMAKSIFEHLGANWDLDKTKQVEIRTGLKKP